ncbi:cytochrome c biogenesis heme-transporting ATPase CcmA [Denitrificimonas sp. JX-1]|uniref:Cytochrome c biogenesis heme-transporting ATPase CcmA n=1 Tax=Denitrificimonas halotolerans TaxID=3098930 RepID=A0ABU5GPZ8_9GAMM|nr:cytochrome c biogenesis heme-transporting ATPase CcmA [Denitrificimonas sp. JX-1]MDY7219063.1 cytochrome c biogenesis heme-transporting ATPase CcmA [Denitrificimonas sp. JX-1]
MSDVYLETIDLACERDWRPLFEHLNISVKPKDMLQVSGPNGSGKTSLLRLMSGLMQPTAGEVLVKGRRIQQQRGELASNLLWIGHAAGIKGVLTAEENLAWLSALHHKANYEQIWRALAAVGLAGFEDVPCYTLSAGQQRRVALARLYLESAPALWILDEPFTALDKQAVTQLELHLAAHCNKGGMVVFTTHHPIQNVPDTFRELDLGRAIE